MTIDNSGKVGVVTTTPNALLEVASAGSGVDELRIGTNNAYEIKFVGTVATNIYSSGSGAPMYISTNNAPLYIGTTADGQNLSIVNNNVGIGTTGPAAKLHVSGGNILLDNNQALYFKDSGGTARSVLSYSSADNISLSGVAGTDIFIGNSYAIVSKSSGNT